MKAQNPVLGVVNSKVKQKTLVDLTALHGFSEDEALEWAIAHDVDFDVAECVTDYAHLVGTVLSAERGDDDRVTIVIGSAAPAADEPADVDPFDDVDVDETTVADVDDFFTAVRSENEAIAAGSSLDDVDLDDDLAPYRALDPVAPRPAPSSQPRRGLRLRRPSKPAAFAIVALISFGGFGLAVVSGGESSPSSRGSSPSASPLRAPWRVELASRPAGVDRSSRAVSEPSSPRRSARRSKPRRDSSRRQNPTVAPRPTVANPLPAAPPSGGCGSRSSEFSIEC